MLEHEEQKAETQESAAQARVTAEEFARAVARYQARREAAAQHLEGTVTIGEAVQELGLEATPEELLEEVRAVRAEQGRKTRVRVPDALAWTGGGLLVLFFLSLSWTAVRQGTSRAAPTATEVPATPRLVTTLTGPGDTRVLDKNGAKPLLDTLGTVPNDRPVQCVLSATGERIALADFSGNAAPWTLIKHGGHVYLRGWIAAMSPAALRAGPVEICDVPSEVPTGAAPQPVTLRLDHFTCDPSRSSDAIISATNIVTDEHFAEPWPGAGRRQPPHGRE